MKGRATTLEEIRTQALQLRPPLYLHAGPDGAPRESYRVDDIERDLDAQARDALEGALRRKSGGVRVSTQPA
jgi:hypothetical protein